MLFNKLTSALIAAASMSLAAADDFPTIDVVGNKFFYSNNGSQFYIRGVAYQADVTGEDNDTFVDPLADETTCKRDLPYLTEINTNVLRVYALDTTADHDACMQLFEAAGIYVIADLAEPTLSIATTDPEWTVELYERYTSVIDMMQGYDNVLGFFAGNEVITNNTNTDAAPFVKAAIRDMKTYISDKGYRSIPVGYSANDDSKTRVGSADYFSCGDDDVKADFYGINMYEWCGSSNFKTSGYEDRTEDFANLTIPAFFSEYGCNAVQPRKFTEIGTLFSDEMTDVWSGGIVYMYFEEVNNYGLVSEIDSTSVSTMADFQYYSSEMNAISPTSAKSSDISTSASQLACPTTNANWKAATKLPPTPQQGTCDCMYDSLSCIIDKDVDEDDYADLFDYVCNLVDCDGISADGKTGTYGSYSFCSPKEQLSFILNLYYNAQGGDSSACDFSGSASLVTGTTYKSCATVLSQAGASGLGSISATVSATQTDSTSTKDSKTTDSASSSESSTKSDKTTASSVSSISSTSKGEAANVVGSSFVMGFAGVVAALFL